jgi:hypothetical protein
MRLIHAYSDPDADPQHCCLHANLLMTVIGFVSIFPAKTDQPATSPADFFISGVENKLFSLPLSSNKTLTITKNVGRGQCQES